MARRLYMLVGAWLAAGGVGCESHAAAPAREPAAAMARPATVEQPERATAISDGGLRGMDAGTARAGGAGSQAADAMMPAAGSGGRANTGSAGRAGAGHDRDGRDAGGELRPVTLRFKAMVGSRAFACGTSYAAPGGDGLTFTPADFRFYVYNVHLVTRAGLEVPMALDERAPVQTGEVALVDFGDDTGSCLLLLGTRRQNLTITGQITQGDYTAVVFTTGVPAALNHQDLTQAQPPLDDTSMHWGWANGYRFVSLMLDAQSAAGAVTQTGVHIGSTGCTGSTDSGIKCSRAHQNRVQLDHFDPDASIIVADFSAAVGGLDLSVTNECHSGTAQCASAFAAFGLSPNGEAQSAQRVFRLE